MNQVTISPKENVTLLLVAVPKTIDKPKLFDHHGYWRIGFNYEKGWKEIMTSLPWFEYRNVSIIGLSSCLTEEQAKELVNADDTGDYFEEYTNKKGDRFTATTAKQSVQSLVESSGLTMGKDQDCLILKIN